MDWNTLIQTVGHLPVVTSENLRAHGKGAGAIEVQLSRWTKAGRLMQLKRGVYLIKAPYRPVDVFEPFIAQVLKNPSYVSLEKALEIHGLIPEAVNVVTSVTPKRPGTFSTDVGTFVYRHLQPSLFWGYEASSSKGQMGFVAKPEKALLDLIYLNKLKMTSSALQEFRFQNVEKINLKQLRNFAERFRLPAIMEAAKMMTHALKKNRKNEKEA